MKYLVRLVSLVSFISFACTSGSYAATLHASSCSQPDVQTALNSASSGDTITVPSGDCDWTTNSITIPIDKTIHLEGSGSSSTKISFSGTAITSLSPGSEISGFWFYKTGANTDPQIIIKNTGWRIHNNKIENSYNNNYKTHWAPAINPTGLNATMVPEGLIDHNTIINGKLLIIGAGNQTTMNAAWAASSKLGTEHAVYVEDNDISRGTGVNSVIFDLDYAARAVFRYNTFHGSSGFMHSWNGTANDRGTKSWEIYGNDWNLSSNYGEMVTLDGGTGLVFDNYATAAWTGTLVNHIRDMRIDIWNACDGTSSLDTNELPDGYVCRDQLGTGPDSYDAGSSQPKGDNITKSPAYLWSNYRSTSAVIAASIADKAVAERIVANRDYFDYNTSFDGTSGTGCGTLAARPATCTTGVGYWATTQSCTDMSGMVGPDPSRPISGTLYKCTATNRWTLYYTPYTYPHPLQGTGNNTPTSSLSLPAPTIDLIH